MTKIDFGFDTSLNPTGSFKGIGVGSTLPGSIITGELVGTVRIEDTHYLITKIISAFGSRPEDVGKIDVRSVIADLYPDGSSIVYADMEHGEDCVKMEALLNNERVREKLSSDSLLNTLRDLSVPAARPSYAYSYLATSYNTGVTAINHEVFEKRKDSLKRMHIPLSSVSEELEELRAKLAEYEKPGMHM